jgi:hypothetical protein
VNGEERIEFAEAQGAALRARVTPEREGERADKKECAPDRLHDKTGVGIWVAVRS